MSGPDHETEPDTQNPVLHLFYSVLGLVSVVMVLGLMALTCVDVIGRYFFDSPVEGAFEITEVMLLTLVFTALPLTTARGEHVEVDLVAMICSDRINRWLRTFAALFSAALLATFAWRLAVHAHDAAADGSVTNALAIPLAPFGYLAALACLISALVVLREALRLLRHKDLS